MSSNSYLLLAWVSDKLACKRRKDLELKCLEALWLEIKSKSTRFLLCIIDRQPNLGIAFWELLDQNLAHVVGKHDMHYLVLGDLNADFGTVNGDRLNKISHAYCLSIHNHEPTRITPTSSSVLDQCISMFNSSVISTNVMAPISNTDHSTLCINLKLSKQKQYSYERIMWDFKNSNYDMFRMLLSEVDWSDIFSHGSIDEVYSKWNDKVLNAAKLSIPFKLVTMRLLNTPWYNNYLRSLKRRMQQSYLKYKRSSDVFHRTIFSHYQSFYYSEIKRIKKSTKARNMPDFVIRAWKIQNHGGH